MDGRFLPSNNREQVTATFAKVLLAKVDSMRMILEEVLAVVTMVISCCRYLPDFLVSINIIV